MKSIKDIRTNLENLSESLDSTNDTRKLTTLVRAGLFDAHKLTMLKRALNKDNTKMTRAEKDALIQLLDNLLDVVMSNQGTFTKVKQSIHEEIDPPTEEEINESSKYELKPFDAKSERKKTDVDITVLPTLIIMKRRAIRVFPDGQKVALYWADRINRYISVPFSSIGLSEETIDEITYPGEKAIKDIAKKAAAAKMAARKYGITNDDKDNRDAVIAHSSYKKHLDSLKHSKGGNYQDDMVDAVARNIESRISKRDLARKEKLRKGYEKKVETYKNEKEMRSPKSAVKIGMSHGLAAGAGALIGSGIRALIKPKPVAPVKSKRLEESRINFNNKLNQIRQNKINEGKVKDFAFGDEDDLTLSSVAKDLTPGLGTARAASRTANSWKKGNYGMAALNAVDTAASGVSDAALAAAPITGGLSAPVAGVIDAVRGGVKVASKIGARLLARRAAKKALEKGAAKTGEEAAIKAARRAAAQKRLNRIKSLKWARRAGLAAAALGGGIGGSGGGDSSSSTKTDYKIPQNKAQAFAGAKEIKSIDPNASSHESEPVSTQTQRDRQRSKRFEYGDRKAISEDEDNPKPSKYKIKQVKAQAFAGGREITSVNPNRNAGGHLSTIDRRDRQRSKRFEYGDRKAISENKIDIIKALNETTNLVYEDGTVAVSKVMAQKIVEIYDNLNFKNKKLFMEMINKDKDSFSKIAKFALTNKV
jgi:hypothetical protein